MQFELVNPVLDPAVLAAALHPLDPAARIAVDTRRGRLEILSQATAAQVLDVLDSIGCAAILLEKDVHVSGGSTCCGHCS